jgi:cell wall-associated NlpC family hydrolase
MKQQEADQRAAFVAEAKTWLGTPFRDQGDIKGPNGAVDCAMLLVRCAASVGLIPADFDPRPYPPQWLLHKDEERFLGVVSEFGKEVQRPPIPGDVMIYKVARCFAHGGIVIEKDRIIHAYYKTRHVEISALNEVELAFLPTGKPRPSKVFDLWAHRAAEAQGNPTKQI